MRPKANGSYVPLRGEPSSRGVISGNRRSWLRLDKISVILYRYHGRFLASLPEGSAQAVEYEPLIDEFGDDIAIMLQTEKSKAMVFLTDLTSEELTAFQEFIDEACVRARPVVEARDKISQEVYDEYGDDSHTRLYRALPVLHARKGEGDKYDQSLRERSAGTSVMEGRLRVTPVASVGDRIVAERNARERSAEDDGTPTDLEQGVREVGGTGELPF